MSTTAAIILIGNELLSGKIADANAQYAIGRLRDLGVDLRRIAMVPDDETDIVEEVSKASARYDHVFTSGGVGPTHDDITMACVAKAFGVPVVRHPRLAEILTAHFGERLLPEHLLMADLPEGATLIEAGTIRWPVTQMHNVYVLPGVPALFRDKFDAIAEGFRSGAFYLRSIYLDADEAEIAVLLAQVETDHAVSIGSYPRWDIPDYRIRVTVEARSRGPVDAAIDALVASLPPEKLVRVEPWPAEG